MTENAHSVKATISKFSNDYDTKSTWLNKPKLTKKALVDLISYFEKKKYMLVFLVRNVRASRPERMWAQLPTSFLFCNSNETGSSIKADQDFIYVQHRFADGDTEEQYQTFIKHLKTDYFKDKEKYLWLDGVLQSDL